MSRQRSEDSGLCPPGMKGQILACTRIVSEEDDDMDDGSWMWPEPDEKSAPRVPVEPILAFPWMADESPIVAAVLEQARYPPLMQTHSWTKAVPYKVRTFDIASKIAS